ncbi:MAG: type II 3-dehydroquinate dehydratase [bacterium]|nr:type II 3-dehydroquinate dehydratase [bacterium]
MTLATAADSASRLVRVLVLHGANLNMLGIRELGVYGKITLFQINRRLRSLGNDLGVDVVDFQSNHEGALIDRLHRAHKEEDGVVFNPGAFTHYSYALHDAVKSIRPPVVEVHLSDIRYRELWRRKSVIAPACIRQISGRGIESYLEGLRHVAGRIRGEC